MTLNKTLVLLILAAISLWIGCAALTTSSKPSEPVTISFLYAGDMHGIATESKGLPIIAERIRVIRDSNNLKDIPTQVIIGGNSLPESGTEDYIAALNKIDIDFLTLGPRDLELKLSDMKLIAEKSLFPVLASNVMVAGQKLPLAVIHTTKKIYGYKFAFLSIVELPNKNAATGVEVLDPVRALENMLPFIEESSDFIVLMTHISPNTFQWLTQVVESLTIIYTVGTEVSPEQALQKNKTIIHNAGIDCKYLSEIQLTINPKDLAYTYTSKLHPAGTIADPEITRLVTKVVPAAQKVPAQEPQAPAQESITAEVKPQASIITNLNTQDIQTRQTDLGKIIAEAIQWRTQADIGVIPAGVIAEGLPDGAIAQQDLNRCIPDVQTVVVLLVTGTELQDLLINNIPALANTPNYLQVSDNVNDLEILPDNVYRIATIKGVSELTDQYPALAKVSSVAEMQYDLKDALRLYFKNKQMFK